MVRSLYTSAHMEEDIYITFYPVYGCQHIKGQFRVIFYSQFNGEVKSNTKICNFGSGGWISTCCIWTEDLPSLFNSKASLTSLFFSFGFSFIMVTRWERALPIKGTQSYHHFEPDPSNEDFIVVKHFSNSDNLKKMKVLSHTKVQFKTKDKVKAKAKIVTNKKKKK